MSRHVILTLLGGYILPLLEDLAKFVLPLINVLCWGKYRLYSSNDLSQDKKWNIPPTVAKGVQFHVLNWITPLLGHIKSFNTNRFRWGIVRFSLHEFPLYQLHWLERVASVCNVHNQQKLTSISNFVWVALHANQDNVNMTYLIRKSQWDHCRLWMLL